MNCMVGTVQPSVGVDGALELGVLLTVQELSELQSSSRAYLKFFLSAHHCQPRQPDYPTRVVGISYI